jgi:hypothetical protein
MPHIFAPMTAFILATSVYNTIVLSSVTATHSWASLDVRLVSTLLCSLGCGFVYRLFMSGCDVIFTQ